MQSKVSEQKVRLDARLDWRDYIVYIAFVIVFLFFAITIGSQGFLQMSNLLNIIRATTMITILATAMTFVIASAEIDLSVGSTAAFAALCSALAMKAGMGFVSGIVVGVLAGAVVGCVNGFFITIVGIPSFLVTLGMSQVVRGVDLWITNTSPVMIMNTTFNNVFGQGSVGPIPAMLIWSVAVLILGHITLKKTAFGRQILATGGNTTAAEYSGVNTKKIRFYALLLASIAAGIVGMLYAGQMQTARDTIGTGDELNAIAAVILGGTSLYGGKGTIIGTIIGSLLIGTINNGLIILGLNISQQMVVSGAVIILAVSFAKRPKQA